ncbi:unnamed protein product [Brachionus calyciflorus]|uniref:Uncharacterized protein n=1 Tax=Brachionus calyciflorus TaxID=104777 RepID=A0A814MKL2_9BILA|nr:unnamed protein product [Brachionus calyciflorus]
MLFYHPIIDLKKVHHPMIDLDIMVNINFIKKVIERCSSENTGPNKIYGEEPNEKFKRLETDEEKKFFVPRFGDIKYGLQKRRSKTRPKLPDSLRKTILDGIYTKTSNKIDKFLIYKPKKKKKLGFCSKIGLEILSKSSEWHEDGTFHVAAKYFY